MGTECPEIEETPSQKIEISLQVADPAEETELPILEKIEEKSVPEPFQKIGVLTNDLEIPEESYIETNLMDKDIILVPLSPTYALPTTRTKSKLPGDKVNCPFCKVTTSRRGIIQHVNYSHADSYKKFRTSKEYIKILPMKCFGCNMLFAGKESLRTVSQKYN